jgi:predicted dehydrogenase
MTSGKRRRKLRVGLAGLQQVNQQLAAYGALGEEYEVRAVFDADRAAARAAAEVNAIEYFTCDFAMLCELKDIDVLHIATPAARRASHVLQALDAGKDVICQQPIGVSLADLDLLIHAESRHGRRVMPLAPHRYARGVQRLAHLVQTGVTGKPLVAAISVARRRDPGPPSTDVLERQDEGGVLVTCGAQYLDLVYHLLGRARRMYASSAARPARSDQEDCVSASIELTDGALVSLALVLGAPVDTSQHRWVFGNLVAESNAEPAVDPLARWGFSGESRRSDERVIAALERFTPVREGLVGQLAAFHAAVCDEERLPVTMSDARLTVEWMTALYRAAAIGKAVSLPVRPGDPMYSGWAPAPGGMLPPVSHLGEAIR